MFSHVYYILGIMSFICFFLSDIVVCVCVVPQHVRVSVCLCVCAGLCAMIYVCIYVCVCRSVCHYM